MYIGLAITGWRNPSPTSEPQNGFTIIGPFVEEAATAGQIESTNSLVPGKKEALRQMVQDAESQLTEIRSQKLP